MIDVSKCLMSYMTLCRCEYERHFPSLRKSHRYMIAEGNLLERNYSKDHKVPHK